MAWTTTDARAEEGRSTDLLQAVGQPCVASASEQGYVAPAPPCRTKEVSSEQRFSLATSAVRFVFARSPSTEPPLAVLVLGGSALRPMAKQRRMPGWSNNVQAGQPAAHGFARGGERRAVFSVGVSREQLE